VSDFLIFGILECSYGIWAILNCDFSGLGVFEFCLLDVMGFGVWNFQFGNCFGNLGVLNLGVLGFGILEFHVF